MRGFSHSGVHSKKSQATDSAISKVGCPAGSTCTFTVPVGCMVSICRYWLRRPMRCNRRPAVRPNASLPTRLATTPRSPSRLVMYAKFAGAPPSSFPFGKMSQRSSPRPTTVKDLVSGMNVVKPVSGVYNGGPLGCIKTAVHRRRHGLAFWRSSNCAAALSSRSASWVRPMSRYACPSR